MPQNIRSKMIGGFKVSQGRRQRNLSKGQDNLSGTKLHKTVDARTLRYSLKQYDDLIAHMWKQNLDPEGSHEISEGKFFRFLRENKIITEKKQLDEMYKQCLF